MVLGAVAYIVVVTSVAGENPKRFYAPVPSFAECVEMLKVMQFAEPEHSKVAMTAFCATEPPTYKWGTR